MAKAISVDFSKTGEGKGGALRVAPGDYAVKVKKVVAKESKENKPYLNWELVGVNGALKGQTIYHITSLQEQALFNLRNTLLACKVNVPKSKMKVDLDSLVGKILGITVDDDEYKGKVKSAVVDVYPISIKNGKVVKEALPTGDDIDTSEDEEDLDDLDDDDEDEDEDDDV